MQDSPYTYHPMAPSVHEPKDGVGAVVVVAAAAAADLHDSSEAIGADQDEEIGPLLNSGCLGQWDILPLIAMAREPWDCLAWANGSGHCIPHT